jgi:hypothetical protein
MPDAALSSHLAVAVRRADAGVLGAVLVELQPQAVS